MSIKSSKNSTANNFGLRLRQRFGELLQENCPLSQFVRPGVGGVAEYVLVVSTIQDLIDACTLAAEFNRPFAVIGGGTATLPSHVGALGLVLINRTTQLHFSETTSLVVAESGVGTGQLVAAAASHGLGGLEFLTGIPGTVGGAVATNATYQGRTISSFLRAVVAWLDDGSGYKVVTLAPNQLSATAGRPAFSKIASRPVVILSIHLQFSQLYPEEVMRRLRAYRERGRIVNRPSARLGSPFAPLLEAEPRLSQAVGRLRSPGLRINTASGVIEATRSGVQPNDYRQFLAAIQTLAAAAGINLDDRVTYLGYWPDVGDK